MVGHTVGLCLDEALGEGDREVAGERLQLPVEVSAPRKPLGVAQTDAVVEEVGCIWVPVALLVREGEPHALRDHCVVADALGQPVLLGVRQLVPEALG